jgi:hypothetical protein
MSNLTSVTLTSGVPTVGTGTVSTLDNLPTLLNALPVVASAGTNLNTSTLALESGGNLATIATNTGAATAAGTNVIGKIGIDQTVQGTTNAVVPLSATAGGVLISRTLVPNNTTAVVVKASAGQVYSVRVTNNSATIAYLKLYNATSATAGSGTPVDTILIPASTSGAGIIVNVPIGIVFNAGITFIVTTGYADADTTAPAASAYIVTVLYR